MKNIFDCQKVTLFVISKNLYLQLIESASKDKHKYIHSVEYWDS